MQAAGANQCADLGSRISSAGAQATPCPHAVNSGRRSSAFEQGELETPCPSLRVETPCFIRAFETLATGVRTMDHRPLQLCSPGAGTPLSPLRTPHDRQDRDRRRGHDVPDDGLHHLRAADGARRRGDGLRRGARRDLSRQRHRDAVDGVPGELPDRRGARDGPQLLLRLHGRRRDAGAVADCARRGRGRGADLHPDGRRRPARAAHPGDPRVAQARDGGRHRPARRAHRPRVGRHRRRLSRHARHARQPEVRPRAADPVRPADDGGADGEAGEGRAAARDARVNRRGARGRARALPGDREPAAVDCADVHAARHPRRVHVAR